ncbi:PilX N-terminal domain-containing pilus assembly protein [Pseudomonas syringae]
MKNLPLHTAPTFAARQRGMVLLVSLVFLLLLTMLGISSMQNATLQEKMAGSVGNRNKSFQMAEAVLRRGESTIVSGFSLARCIGTVACAPPAESTSVTGPGVNATSGVNWISTNEGLYGIQYLGTTNTPIKRPATCPGSGTVMMYRVTAVAVFANSRTVLESIYANC